MPEKANCEQQLHRIERSKLRSRVLNAVQPVLVGFWAAWSASCKAMTPVLESVAKDDAVSVKIARVSVEDHENLTDQYGVRAVPTLLLFNQGTLQDKIIGRTTEQTVRESLERLM
jgi:thioredoxin 1